MRLLPINSFLEGGQTPNWLELFRASFYEFYDNLLPPYHSLFYELHFFVRKKLYDKWYFTAEFSLVTANGAAILLQQNWRKNPWVDDLNEHSIKWRKNWTQCCEKRLLSPWSSPQEVCVLQQNEYEDARNADKEHSVTKCFPVNMIIFTWSV